MARSPLLLFAALVVFGCATPTTTRVVSPTFEEGRLLIESGRLEEGLAKVMEATREEPGNREYRAYYFRQRDAVVQHYVALGDAARAAGAFDEAEEAYKRAVALDAANARARTGLEWIPIDRRHRALLREAQDLMAKGDSAGATAKVREVLAQNASNREAQSLLRKLEEANAAAASDEPKLGAALQKPVTMEFRDAPVRSVFEAISRYTGLNFIFDRDVRADLRTTVFVRDTRVEDVIRFVLVTSQLERKVLNENTVLVYPNTSEKLRAYKDLVMRSFYLANADAKTTANMIKALVKTPDIYVDEKLNMVMIRDTPEAVRVAEKLVANQDLAEPEVVLEVEVLEVGTNVLNDLGVQWPSQLSYSLVGAAGTPGQLTLPEWLNRNSGLVRLTFTDPLFSLNLRKQDGLTNVLANPRIRVKNHEKARIHIGDRVPVITTTASATGFVGESVTYLDVGLKLEVEPTVYLEDDVGIKVGLEVSNITQQVRSASGTTAYQVGTRNAATTLRLKDGETQILAGLINDEDRRSANKVPGLGDVPGLEYLFGRQTATLNKTEVILLITPHVVRNLGRPDARLTSFSAGTDAQFGGGGLSLGSVPGVQGAVLPAPPAPVPAPGPGAPASGAPAAAPGGSGTAPAAPAVGPGANPGNSAANSAATGGNPPPPAPTYGPGSPAPIFPPQGQLPPQ